MGKELFVCVVNRPEAVEDVIAAFLSIGVTGCTVIDSKGMGKIISQDIPIFAGFQSLFAGVRESNVTILSVMDAELVDEAIRVVEETYMSFTEPSSGIIFTVPVNKVRGVSKE